MESDLLWSMQFQRSLYDVPIWDIPIIRLMVCHSLTIETKVSLMSSKAMYVACSSDYAVSSERLWLCLG